MGAAYVEIYLATPFKPQLRNTHYQKKQYTLWLIDKRQKENIDT